MFGRKLTRSETIIGLAIGALALFLALFLPIAMRGPYRPPSGTLCTSHQRQLVQAMITYAAEHDGHWPVVHVNSQGFRQSGLNVSPSDRVATSVASFEFLSEWSGGELVAKLFACPGAPTFRPHQPASGTSPVSAWAAAVTSLNDPDMPGYAYDWAVPPQHHEQSRVVLADRGHRNHGGKVVACFTDSHTETLTGGTGIGRGHVTHCLGSSEAAEPAFTSFREISGHDNIFDDHGDGDQLTIGAGSQTRAWVK